MHILYTPHHATHVATSEITNGQPTPHQEIPARLETILAAVKTHGWQPQSDTQTDGQTKRDWLASIHTAPYLAYLQQSAQLDEDAVVYPSVWPYQTGQHATTIFAQAGEFCFDMFTPITRHTYDAAYAAANTARQAATLVHQGERVVYSLGRPPGHHAESNRAGGYCYLNNAAVAANYLTQFGKVATLDIDFHHGNGTQHIFYDSDQVLTVSLHADPNWKFPYFSGFEAEIGQGKGEGYNLNVCLGPGTTDQQYHRRLGPALQKIRDFAPSSLVVSFGADIHRSDPIGGFAITTEYLTVLAKTIAALELPTVIVQEGGYNTAMLGENVVAFLLGFE